VTPAFFFNPRSTVPVVSDDDPEILRFGLPSDFHAASSLRRTARDRRWLVAEDTATDPSDLDRIASFLLDFACYCFER